MSHFNGCCTNVGWHAVACPAVGGQWSPSVAAEATDLQPQSETDRRDFAVSCCILHLEIEQKSKWGPVTNKLFPNMMVNRDSCKQVMVLCPCNVAKRAPLCRLLRRSHRTWPVRSCLRRGGAGPAPFPSCSSMCLLFTCKMWASPPCSNHTFKTDTPCYDPALPANIKKHISVLSTHPGTSIPQLQYKKKEACCEWHILQFLRLTDYWKDWRMQI